MDAFKLALIMRKGHSPEEDHALVRYRCEPKQVDGEELVYHQSIYGTKFSVPIHYQSLKTTIQVENHLTSLSQNANFASENSDNVKMALRYRHEHNGWTGFNRDRQNELSISINAR